MLQVPVGCSYDVSVTGDVTTGSWSQMTEPTPWTASDDLMMSYPFMLDL